MFDEFRERFDKVRYQANELRQLLGEVQLKIRENQRTIGGLIDLLYGDRLYRYAFTEITLENTELFQQNLISNFLSRVQSIEEFKDSVFTDRIVEIITDKNPIVLERDGNSIRVRIEMEQVAGNLEDYSSGILYARNILSQERKTDKKITALQASNYWKNIIYLPKEEPYNTTIQLRLESFGQLAPYWKLIEEGVPQPLSAGYGGFPYPTSAPARFVAISTEEISIIANQLFQEKVYERNNTTRNAIRYYERDNEELNILAEDILRALEQWIEVGTPDKYQTARGRLKERLGERVNAADPKKLNALINQLAAGEEVPNRIRIGGGVRIRLITLTREIDAELGRTPRL
jgi:hypothetical protein